MKKALFISPVLPNSNGGGREKRAHQWMKKLSKEYKVSLLVISAHLDIQRAEYEYVEEIHVIRLSSTGIKKWIELLISIVKLLFGKAGSSKILGWCPLSKENARQLAKIFSGRHFDYVLCFRLYLKDFAVFIEELVQSSCMELDLDDIESTTRLKMARLYLKRRYYIRACLFFLSSYYFRLKEKSIESLFGQLYVCSNEDQTYLKNQLSTMTIDVMPNRLYGEAKQLPLPTNPYQLLFIGTLTYYPNEEAVGWFIDHVLSELRRRDFHWTLHVVGDSNNDTFVNMLKTSKGVNYHGHIPLLDDIYTHTFQVISPLHAGGGTKLKILEAMWYGRPIIATNESVHGLGLTPFVHYLPAETPEEFIHACQQLVDEPAAARQMVEEARRILSKNFTY